MVELGANQHLGGADWHFGVPTGIPILSQFLTFFQCIFCVFEFFLFFFFENFFSLFGTMKHFPSQLQTLKTYLNLVMD